MKDENSLKNDTQIQELTKEIESLKVLNAEYVKRLEKVANKSELSED